MLHCGNLLLICTRNPCSTVGGSFSSVRRIHAPLWESVSYLYEESMLRCGNLLLLRRGMRLLVWQLFHRLRPLLLLLLMYSLSLHCRVPRRLRHQSHHLHVSAANQQHRPPSTHRSHILLLTRRRHLYTVYGYSYVRRTPASPPRELTCHMGSHSVTCHPADVTFPPLPQPKLVLD